MELYLLKSAACLAILFVFYKLFMESESFHTTKRFYLLGAVIASFVIPLITFTTYIEVVQIPTPIFEPIIEVTDTSQFEVSTNYTPYIFWTIYLIGFSVFLLKFSRNLYRLVQKAYKNPCVKNNNVFHVLLQTPTTPHTFFKYIFLNKRKFQKKEIPEEVLIHEHAHAIQKHSIDVIFIEFFQVIFWFNPFVYFFKKSIKLNHEFLADHAVLKHGSETTSYQNILLAFSSNALSPAMANSINYSSFKKRFTVMKKQSSKKSIWLRSLVLLPLAVVLVYTFSSMKEVEKIASNTKISNFENPEVQKEYENWYQDTLRENEISATPEQLLQYNKLAAYWNTYFRETGEKKIPLTELEKLETIYKIMSPLQKEKAQPFPSCELSTETSTTNTNEKFFEIRLQDNRIMLNGKSSSLRTFTNDIDVLTQDWEEQEYTSIRPKIFVSKSCSKDFLQKADAAYKKTHFSKANNGLGLLPPPPPPKPIKVIKGENDTLSNIPPPPPIKVIKGENDAVKNIPPPPPPPPPSNSLGDVLKDYKNSIILYVNGESIYLNGKKVSINSFTAAIDKQTKNWEPEDFKLYGLSVQTENVSDSFIERINSEYSKSNLAKRSSRKNPYIIGSQENLPPPPPPTEPGPDEPLDHIVAMAKRNGTFFYKGRKITSDKAIELLKKNPKLNIQTRLNDPKPPMTFISKKPIRIGKKG